MIAFVFLGSSPTELLNQPLEDFVEFFNQFYDSESWQSEGVSASNLKQWCVQNGYGFYFAMGYKLLESVEPNGKNRSIAISSWNGHCYMYKSAKLVSQLRDLPYEVKNSESGGESINFVRSAK